MKKLFLSIFTIALMFTVALCGCDNKELYQGEFYTLQEAYDGGYLTKEDLKSIAYYHNGGTEGNEEIMGENYQPQPKTPAVLNKFTELSIKRTFWEDYTKYQTDDLNLNDIGVSYYFTCKNCIALMIWCNNWAYSDVFFKVTVGGVQFTYTCGNEIKIWKAKS